MNFRSCSRILAGPAVPGPFPFCKASMRWHWFPRMELDFPIRSLSTGIRQGARLRRRDDFTAGIRRSTLQESRQPITFFLNKSCSVIHPDTDYGVYGLQAQLQYGTKSQSARTLYAQESRSRGSIKACFWCVKRDRVVRFP